MNIPWRYIELAGDPERESDSSVNSTSRSRIFSSKSTSSRPRMTLSFYSPERTKTKSQQMGMDSRSMDRVSALMGLTLKCCVLASVAIVANWIFLFIADVWLFDLSWFICIDCLLNGICVYFMFKFTEKQYNIFCKPVIEIWKVFGVCCGITRFNLTKMVERFELMDDSGVDLEIMPSDIVLPNDD